MVLSRHIRWLPSALSIGMSSLGSNKKPSHHGCVSFLLPAKSSANKSYEDYYKAIIRIPPNQPSFHGLSLAGFVAAVQISSNILSLPSEINDPSRECFEENKRALLKQNPRSTNKNKESQQTCKPINIPWHMGSFHFFSGLDILLWNIILSCT